MNSEEQAVYTKVLEDSARSYLKVTSQDKIFTNPLGAKNHQVDGFYPDIVVYLPTGEIIMEVVETESTINEKAKAKWQDLTNLGRELRVLVPFSAIEAAKRIAYDLPNINFQAYDAEEDQIHWFGKNNT